MKAKRDYGDLYWMSRPFSHYSFFAMFCFFFRNKMYTIEFGVHRIKAISFKITNISPTANTHKNFTSWWLSIYSAQIRIPSLWRVALFSEREFRICEGEWSPAPSCANGLPSSLTYSGPHHVYPHVLGSVYNPVKLIWIVFAECLETIAHTTFWMTSAMIK